MRLSDFTKSNFNIDAKIASICDSLQTYKVDAEPKIISTEELINTLLETFPESERPVIVWGVPSSGWNIAYILSHLGLAVMVEDGPEYAEMIVDDIIVTGMTELRYEELYPEKIFYAPYNRPAYKLIMPWKKR